MPVAEKEGRLEAAALDLDDDDDDDDDEVCAALEGKSPARSASRASVVASMASVVPPRAKERDLARGRERTGRRKVCVFAG